MEGKPDVHNFNIVSYIWMLMGVQTDSAFSENSLALKGQETLKRSGLLAQ